MRPVDQPAWLVPLLEDGVVRGHDAFARVRHAYPFGEGADPPPASPSDARDVQYIAAVDEFDVNLVKDIYALTPTGRTGDGAMWWVRAASGWAREVGDPLLPANRRLVAVSRSLSEDVERQLDNFASGRGSGRPEREALRLRLLRALRHEGVGSIDTPWGYLQWAGHERGLRLEAADGQDAELPLQDELMTQLRWLGWRAPDGESRNAWLDLIGDDAVDAALDLVTRTLSTVRLRPPPPGPLNWAQWPPDPNHDDAQPDGPHYFDARGELNCLLCERPPGASVHRRVIIQTSPRPSGGASRSMGDLEAVRDEARALAGRAGTAPLVVIDLVDAFVDTEHADDVMRLPVERVDRLVRATGTDAAASRLTTLAEQGAVHLHLSVRSQIEGVLEGMPRPFRRFDGAGPRLAGLCRALSLNGVQVLVCSLWPAADDPFFGALSHVEGMAWLGDEPHRFEPADLDRCVCTREEVHEIHSTWPLAEPVFKADPAGGPTNDLGPCPRCLVRDPEHEDGSLFWVPDGQREPQEYPYTTECLLCGTRAWRTEHESRVVANLDELLAATGRRSLEELAESIEEHFDDLFLDIEETRAEGPTISCNGMGVGLPYPVDLADFWNLCEGYEQSQWVEKEDDEDDEDDEDELEELDRGDPTVDVAGGRWAVLESSRDDGSTGVEEGATSMSKPASAPEVAAAQRATTVTRVLVVAASRTYQEYLDHGLYARGPNPQFQKDFTHVAFYVRGEIQRHVAQIERRYDDVLQTAESIDALNLGGDHAQRIRHRIGRGDPTLRHRVFFLTRPEEPGTVWLPRAIPRREGDFAYTMGTRYAWLEDLVAVSLRRGLTCDLGG